MFIDKKLITTNRSGFTLVELIVVISILAILGTIAFLSFGWYSASARDAKRSQNLDDIAKAMTIGQANGNSIISYAKTGNASLSNYTGVDWLAWTGNAIFDDATKYVGWDINTTALGLKATDYVDPSSNDPYKIWVTTLAGWAFELAATMEAVNNTKTTRIVGNFRSRTIADSTATITAWTWTTSVTISTAGIGKLKVSDTVDAAWVTTTISNISADGTKLTLAGNAGTTGTDIKLVLKEVDSLIKDSATDASIKDWSTTLFPYKIN